MAKRKKLIDGAHPFFRPAWRRWVIVILLLGWTIFELWNGSVIWAAIFGVLAAMCIREFFIVYNPEADEDPDA